MALKDWKKGDFVNHLFEYEHKRKNIKLNAIDTSHSMFKVKYPIHLEIFKSGGFGHYRNLYSKVFSSKSQALKFAKLSMRKR